MRTIRFYRLPSGQSPVEEFLDQLTAKQAQRAAWVLQLVEELRVVPAQYLSKMVGTDSLWEIRVQAELEALRFFCFFDGARIVVVAHAISKKTIKTPLSALRLAEKRKKDYFARKKQ